jgi:hypothetical protein
LICDDDDHGDDRVDASSRFSSATLLLLQARGTRLFFEGREEIDELLMSAELGHLDANRSRRCASMTLVEKSRKGGRDFDEM